MNKIIYKDGGRISTQATNNRRSVITIIIWVHNTYNWVGPKKEHDWYD